MRRRIAARSGRKRRVISQLLFLCVSILLGGETSAIAQNAAGAAQPLFETKIATDGDLLLVPVMVQKRAYQFMVDTGSSVTIFDRLLREKLGRTTGHAVSTAREQQVEVVRPENVTVGKLPVLTDGLVLDLSDLASIVGTEFSCRSARDASIMFAAISHMNGNRDRRSFG